MEGNNNDISGIVVAFNPNITSDLAVSIISMLKDLECVAGVDIIKDNPNNLIIKLQARRELREEVGNDIMSVVLKLSK
jgi:hypothetical protein